MWHIFPVLSDTNLIILNSLCLHVCLGCESTQVILLTLDISNLVEYQNNVPITSLKRDGESSEKPEFELLMRRKARISIRKLFSQDNSNL